MFAARIGTLLAHSTNERFCAGCDCPKYSATFYIPLSGPNTYGVAGKFAPEHPSTIGRPCRGDFTLPISEAGFVLLGTTAFTVQHRRAAADER